MAPHIQPDQLIANLKNDISHNDMQTAAADAAAIIRRDTDLSNPANTTKNLQRDADSLLALGMPEATLEKLGFPKAHIEIPPSGNGAVITDGKTTTPISESDVVKHIAPTDHGKPIMQTVQNGSDQVTTYKYPDGWSAVRTVDSDGVSRFVEKSPDNKESNIMVSYPDGFKMIQSTNADGTHEQLIKYPPTADGKVYEELTDKDGHTLKLVDNYHGIKNAPILIDDDYSDVQGKYADRVQGESRVMDYERRKAGLPAQ
jgi:hypothetical protein